MLEIWWFKVYFFVFALFGIEFFLLSKKTQQYWPGQLLAQDFHTGAHFFHHFFSPKIYNLMCFLRIFCFMGMIFPHYLFSLVIFFTQIYFALRYRGSFNGGSDYLGLIISLGASLILLFPGNTLVIHGVLYYLALQLSLSYFFAGLIKIKKPLWQKGLALPQFLNHTIFFKSTLIKKLTLNTRLMFLLSWMIMLWEITFPLAWLNPQWCLISCAIGLIFHLANFWFFGLNRFLLLWPLLYPILYLVTTKIH